MNDYLRNGYDTVDACEVLHQSVTIGDYETGEIMGLQRDKPSTKLCKISSMVFLRKLYIPNCYSVLEKMMII